MFDHSVFDHSLSTRRFLETQASAVEDSFAEFVQVLAPHMRAHFAWLAMSGCVGWPARTGNPPHRPDIDGTPPILLLNALLTYDRWGHGVLDRTECTRAAVDNYLLDGTPPGAHCPIGNAMSQISSPGAAEAKSAR